MTGAAMDVGAASARDDASHSKTRPTARTSGSSDAMEESANGKAGSSETNDLLRALVAVTGRVAFPEERLRLLVSSTRNAAYLRAYQMCDGCTSLRAIAKETGLDHSNLSKTVTKWLELGIAFRLGHKKYPFHLYLLATDTSKSRTTSKGGESQAPSVLKGRRNATYPAASSRDDSVHAGEQFDREEG